jgi:hypothetical protein
MASLAYMLLVGTWVTIYKPISNPQNITQSAGMEPFSIESPRKTKLLETPKRKPWRLKG